MMIPPRAHAHFSMNRDSIDLKLTLEQALQSHGAGRLQQAETLYRRILEAEPEHVEALHYLGVIGLQCGRFADAARLIGTAVRLEPRNHDALVNLGTALQALGRHDDAIDAYRQALALTPRSAAVRANLGNALAQLGRVDEAIEQYEAALAIEPGLVEVRRNLANALLVRSRPDEALHHVQQAANADPDAIEIRLSMGNVLQALGKTHEAIACFEAVLEAMPDAAPVLCSLGDAKRELGAVDEAVASYEQALRVDPQNAEAQYCLGVARQDEGDNSRAAAAFRRAVSLDPLCTKAWRAIAGLPGHRLDDGDIETIEVLLRSPELSPEKSKHLEFALGKAREDSGLHAEAIEHYRRGNRLHRASIAYAIERDHRAFDRFKATFDAPFFEAWADAGVADATPIFIVGMPRSGSTLVEQILASHPMVFGAGEVALLPRAIASRFKMSDGTDYTAGLASASGDDFTGVADRYLTELRAVGPRSRHVTDKLLSNFFNVGMIRILFPQARVIHCVRDAIDTCFSIYKHFFGARGLNFAYDLEELGHYYNCYADLLRHWDRMLPGFVHEVRYESLIDDQEVTTRELLDACRLPWHAGCLEFYRTVRPVSTHSSSQVRQPLYRGSIGAWRPYADALAPLIEVLSKPART